MQYIKLYFFVTVNTAGRSWKNSPDRSGYNIL